MILSLMLVTALQVPLATPPTPKEDTSTAVPGPSDRKLGMVVGAVSTLGGVLGAASSAGVGLVSAVLLGAVTWRYGEGDKRLLKYDDTIKYKDDHDRWAWTTVYHGATWGVLGSMGLGVLFLLLIPVGLGTLLGSLLTKESP